MASGASAPDLPYLRKQNLIQNHPVLDRTPPHHAFALEPGLLQDTNRRRIVRECHREDAAQLVIVERPVGHARDRTSCQPAPPELLTQPVAHLRADARNVATYQKSHAANGFAAALDGERTLWFLRLRVVEEVDAIAPCIRM